MPENEPDEKMATPEQLAELRSLAAGSGEDVPDTLRAAEADQRIVELRTQRPSG